MTASRRVCLISVVLPSVVCFAQTIFLPHDNLPQNLSPQNPLPPNVAVHTVSGSVVNSVTGAPVPHALVEISSRSQMRGFTDAGGQFQIAGVTEGPAWVRAEHPGFYLPNARQMEPFQVSAATPKLTVKLEPGGTIRGRVLDNGGDPVDGILISLVQRQVLDGRAQWQMLGTVTSESDGNYEFDDQQPGTYLIASWPRPIYLAFADLVQNGKHLPERYPLTFYPNAADAGGAQSITLSPGAEVTADFALTALPGYKLSGSIDGVTTPRPQIHCEEGGVGLTIAQPSRWDPKHGQFTLFGIPSGSCRLTATEQTANGTSSAEQTVIVKGEDVGNIRMALTPSTPVPIEVSPPGNVNIQLFPLEQSLLFGSARAFVSNLPDGDKPQRLVIQNPRPGKYAVQVQGQGCVQSITYGESDVLRDGLILSENANGKLSVAMRSDCARLTVKIPEPGKQTLHILVVGSDSNLQSFFGGGEQIHFANLAPGEYRIYAIAGDESLEYRNPEVLKAYEAQTVTLNPNGESTVEVRAQAYKENPR